MRKLAPERHISITNEIVREILRSYSIAEFTFEQIHDGIENTSVRVESGGTKYVLRVYSQNRKSDEDVKFEILFQDYLRAHGIPIPAILPNEEGEELTIRHLERKRWQVLLMEYARGTSVTRHASPALIADLAGMQARMHMLGIDLAKRTDRPQKPWVDLRDSLAQRIQRDSISEKDVLDLVDRIERYRYPLDQDLPHGYNHLDIDFDGNVITKDEKVVAIIDFDDVQYSPPVVCLGYTLYSVLDDEGADAMRAYVQTYESIRPLSDKERVALPHVVLFRNYVLAAMRVLLGRPDADIQRCLRLESEIPSIFNRA